MSKIAKLFRILLYILCARYLRYQIRCTQEFISHYYDYFFPTYSAAPSLSNTFFRLNYQIACASALMRPAPNTTNMAPSQQPQYNNINPNERRQWCSNTVNWKDLPDRSIVTNMPDHAVVSNRITTTSTNFITFVPLNLIRQLSKPANIYFLIIAVLQMIPDISLSNGHPLILMPLGFVVFTVMIKDAYEQFYRYLKDREENMRETLLLGANGFEKTNWEELLIGDIIRVDKDKELPCDIVILQSSDDKGRAYVETKNLDGEANLKTKKVVSAQRTHIDKIPPPQLYQERFVLNYEKPNVYLHQFNGNINIRGEVLPLNNANVMLKGSTVKNVMWTVGVCVYTGQHTKLSLNSVKFEAKTSRLQNQLNAMVMVIFVMQFLLSLICAVMNMLLEGSKVKEMNKIPGTKFWINTGSWWLMLTYFVPISLVVTLQLVRIFQGTIMTKDRRTFAPMTGTMPAMNSSSVNENLGQIKYIFSDKTGTLTSNVMNFKKISLKGRVYGEENTLSDRDLQRLPKVEFVDFRDANFVNTVSEHSLAMEVLSLCHEVIVQKQKDGTSLYSSSSPDEVAIINFAKFCGYEFLGEDKDKLLVYNRQQDRIYRYTILAVLEFSSDRKRMSVIVQKESGEIMLYMKGADNLVAKRLAPGTRYMKETQDHIDEFSRVGLRTLMLAYRQIPVQEFQNWKVMYDKASTSLQKRDQLLAEAYEAIEVNLQLLGSTAVEDKLQDGVEDTIRMIMDCHIVFYILTGDKKETAVNIGRSCGMIKPDTIILTPPQNSVEEIQRWLKERSPLPPNSVLLLNASLPLPEVPLHSSICYRCTPGQKQIVVESVKKQTTDLTLAIGDGSNDVNMITRAHVGVGVRGKEGNEVCRVSDFVIGQFSILRILVLYYGREWYRRNAKLVNYNFFKNMYHVLAIVGYGTWSFFSADVIYENWIYQFFNICFTTWPIIVWALVDDEFSMKESLQETSIYERGQRGDYFNQWTYWKNILLGTAYGIISEVIVFGVMEGGIIEKNGRISYAAESGMVLFYNIIIVVNMKVLLMCHGITFIMLISIFVSLSAYWIIYWLYITWFDTNLKESFYTQITTPDIYIIHMLLFSFTLITDFACKKYFEFKKRAEIEATKFRRTSVQQSSIKG